MSGRRLAVAALTTAALAAGVLVASGTGSTARSWAWGAGMPGDPIPGADGRDGLRVLVANDDFALVAREEEGTVAVGAGAGDDVPLEPLEQLAGDDPLVAFAATAPEGGPQRLVGVVRSDIDYVDAVLRDGTTVELPLNEWRAFFYTAPTSSQAAVGLVGHSTDGALGIVRVPQTTAVTQQAPPTASAYTVSNRGRLVTARPSSGLQELFKGVRYRLYLLATRDSRAFYRVQVTPRFTCWAAGKASRIGEIGALACPNLVGTYPLQFEDVAYGAHLPSTRPEILRASGIAVDQAASVALLDRSGRRVSVVPVVDNVYSFPGPFPKSAGLARVALDASGNRLEPRPGDRHQTPPPGIFGPRATRIDPAQLRDIVQRGTSEGVTVSVGNNRTVVFDGGALAPSTRKALQADHVGFHCFQIGGQNVRNTRDVWITARWRPPVAFRVVGVPTAVRRLRHPGHVRAPLARRTRHSQPRRGPAHRARAPLLRRPRDRARSRALRPLAHDQEARHTHRPAARRSAPPRLRRPGSRTAARRRAAAARPRRRPRRQRPHRVQRAERHRQPTVRPARAGQDRRRERPRARVRILSCASCNSAISAASLWPHAWRHLASFQRPARSRPTG